MVAEFPSRLHKLPKRVDPNPTIASFQPVLGTCERAHQCLKIEQSSDFMKMHGMQAPDSTHMKNEHSLLYIELASLGWDMQRRFQSDHWVDNHSNINSMFSSWMRETVMEPKGKSTPQPEMHQAVCRGCSHQNQNTHNEPKTNAWVVFGKPKSREESLSFDAGDNELGHWILA
ncbi:hypothetical protein VNO77_34425 [Canavalia gladiata]|uniref:Uncharacterized protein n=1 Tax=Canavalia gladiata TaxID=3824 RepID=A0AAN9PZS5_CANGL